MAESPHHAGYQEVAELVTGYLERALPADETALFEQHVDFCEGCVWYVEQMRGTIAVSGRIAEDDIPAPARDRLLSAFRGWSGS